MMRTTITADDEDNNNCTERALGALAPHLTFV